MSEKKKLSFGKVWIGLNAASVLVPVIGFFLFWVYKHSSHYGLSFGYALEAAYYSVIDYWFELALVIIPLLVISNVIYATRKSKNVQAVENATPAAVSIPTGEGEQTVLERRFISPIAYVPMALGVVGLLIGLWITCDTDIEYGLPYLLVGVLFGVVGYLLRKAQILLVVTTKRVYLKAPFAARLNLPLNRISAVGTGLFNHLSITSAAGLAGQIRLWFVPKYVEVYDTINALLNEVE